MERVSTVLVKERQVRTADLAASASHGWSHGNEHTHALSSSHAFSAASPSRHTGIIASDHRWSSAQARLLAPHTADPEDHWSPRARGRDHLPRRGKNGTARKRAP